MAKLLVSRNLQGLLGKDQRHLVGLSRKEQSPCTMLS
jgi:hypothetical protein